MEPKTKILAFLDELGISRKKFAENEKIPPGTFHSFLNGETKNLTLELALKISEAMGISVNELCDEGSSWPPPKTSLKPWNLTAEQENWLRQAESIAGRYGPEEVMARLLGPPTSGAESAAPGRQPISRRYPTVEERIAENQEKAGKGAGKPADGPSSGSGTAPPPRSRNNAGGKGSG
jgi:transcriptional regulator with XRE-family HTH domain